MLKATLRRQMLQKRQRYLSEEVDARSQQICRQFFRYFNLSAVRMLHVFLPMAHKNEVNTWYIIEQLRLNFPAIAVAVPVTDLANQTLTHYLLTPATTINQNKWGIPEPSGAKPVTERAIDMVLVPLLAFDEKGHRVGYGKGFYDRFLAVCRPDVLIVGLSLEEERMPLITDVHEADITLQFAVTPSQVCRFNVLF